MKLFMDFFLLSRVCPNLLLSSFHRYALPVNSFLQLGLTLRLFLLILSIWPWFLCFFALESEKHIICKADSEQGETALPSGTSGRLPSADKQRHPLRMQHLSGRVKETLEGEPASKAASKAASGIFPPLHRNIYGIENYHKRRSNNTT